MNELKKKYKRDFGQLRTSMNEFDPCGLIALDFPEYEYDYLTNKVLGLRHRKESRDKIRETILLELKNYFGEDVESYEDVHKAKFYGSLNRFLDKIQELE